MKMVAGITCLIGMPALVFIAPYHLPPDEGEQAVYWTVVSILIVCAVLVLWELRCWVKIDEHGLTQHSPWRGRIQVAWTEIRRVEFVRGGYFVLTDDEGRKLRIHGMMRGIDTLITCFRHVLPRKIYTHAVSKYYEAAKRHQH